ncbi:hypothetical protein DSUL_150125 [Desulfovibrionales bacterium]
MHVVIAFVVFLHKFMMQSTEFGTIASKRATLAFYVFLHTPSHYTLAHISWAKPG